ncbi:MAG: A/G-specific adenine glycosylase [Candidatus Promineofilum sp.]|nr:A/G-specific adenine glycosylase [Promineifilum sp.]
MSTLNVSPALLDWWDEGHADLPWRQSKDAYAVWVAEIMLQQTQIATVIPYYERWMARFPTVEALAAAPLGDVLKFWEGLGYYSRARNLHAAAAIVLRDHAGRLPETVAGLMKLPGIGRYTAGAIASIAYDVPAPILDGNVVRVLSRLYDVAEDVTQPATRRRLWKLAEEMLPPTRPGDFNQALMELGQQICVPQNPRCLICPLRAPCLARQRGTQLERPVRPPRRATPHFDVVAAIIWRDGVPARQGNFLIAQRPLEGLLGGLWEFPGGKVEPGETSADALRREIREELALEVRPGAFVIEVAHAYTHFRITLRAFHAAFLAGDVEHLGVADHAWVTLDDLDRYAFAVTDRKIIDALRGTLSAGTDATANPTGSDR